MDRDWFDNVWITTQLIRVAAEIFIAVLLYLAWHSYMLGGVAVRVYGSDGGAVRAIVAVVPSPDPTPDPTPTPKKGRK